MLPLYDLFSKPKLDGVQKTKVWSAVLNPSAKGGEEITVVYGSQYFLSSATNCFTTEVLFSHPSIIHYLLLIHAHLSRVFQTYVSPGSLLLGGPEAFQGQMTYAVYTIYVYLWSRGFSHCPLQQSFFVITAPQ